MAYLNPVAGNTRAGAIAAQEMVFAEDGAGTYTAAVTIPAGSILLDIVVVGVALWTAATSASLIVGDETDPDGFFTGVNLKATDLLAGETVSFALAGGKVGAYIANSQVTPRYYAAAEVISAVVTSVGAGTAGRTRVVVLYTTGGFETTATKA